MSVPSTVPEWLQWVAGPGAAAVVSLILSWLLPTWPAFKAWWDKVSPKAQQLITIAASNVFGLLAAVAIFGLGYKEAPTGATAWIELVIGYLVLPFFSGVAIRQIIVSNPQQQRLYVSNRTEYRRMLK